MKRSIAIAGNMGVGKSTLVEFLARTYDVKPFYEPNDENPYLRDFYRDMRGWAFQSQLYFLANKFRLHQALDRQPGVVALDRTIFEDAEIFATALYQMRKISKRDWETYRGFYEAILDAIRPPDLLIYLKCSMRTLKTRIRLRGRQMEQDVPARPGADAALASSASCPRTSPVCRWRSTSTTGTSPTTPPRRWRRR